MKPSAFGDYSPICSSYLVEHFLADCRRQNVVKSVHLDVGYDPADPVGETRWLQGVADRHGFPHGIVGYANLALPNVRDILEGHLAFRNVRGIRQSLNYHPDRRRPISTGQAFAARPTGGAALPCCEISACPSTCRSIIRRWRRPTTSRGPFRTRRSS
ncbi:hypothetical protein [Inquilinus limosus]|uniref:hypothetical protein n=1 Tax=Inquilinus limosus TaxID=171674 RepID=UPI000424B3CD|nr:hypothetical protein [Inquilinus limosus]